MKISDLTIIEENVVIHAGVRVGHFCFIQSGCVLKRNADIRPFTVLYRNVAIGEGCVVGPHVLIENDIKLGDGCKVKSGAFICEGVVFGTDIFIGHKVIFCNEKFPKAVRELPWELSEDSIVTVGSGAVIGNGAVILPGVSVGRDAIVGAGAVIVDDVPDGGVVISPKAVPVNERHGDWGDFL